MRARARRKKLARNKTVKISEEARQNLNDQLERFLEKFHREPRADTPEPISNETLTRELNRAAAKIGIDPALIYAMNKTGRILVAGQENRWTEEALAEWNEAIEEYRSGISKPPS
jgi:histone H3/H4